MSSNFSIFLLLVFLMVRKGYTSKEIENKKCHEVNPLKDIDTERLAGNWYGQDIRNLNGTSRKHVLYTVTSNKKNASTILPELMYKMHQNKNSSEFTIELVHGKHKQNAWAIGTDYNTWSTWCSYKPNHSINGVLLTLTREKNPKDAVLRSAQNSVRNVGVKMTKSKEKVKDKPHKKNSAVSMSRLNLEYFVILYGIYINLILLKI